MTTLATIVVGYLITVFLKWNIISTLNYYIQYIDASCSSIREYFCFKLSIDNSVH